MMTHDCPGRKRVMVRRKEQVEMAVMTLRWTSPQRGEPVEQGHCFFLLSPFLKDYFITGGNEPQEEYGQSKYFMC